MDSISCDCKQCGHALGTFVNVWAQVGKSYLSPMLGPVRGYKVRRRGDVRAGEKHTLVEDCKLQDITCAFCDAVVGLACVSTPVNHVFEEKQILFRRTSVVPLAVTGDNQVDFVVKRFLQLRERTSSASNSASTPTDRRGFQPPSSTESHDDLSVDESRPDLQNLQADLDMQREDIDRIDSVGYQIVSAFDKSVLRIENEMNVLQNTLKSLERKLGDNQDDMSALKTEVFDAKKASADTGVVDSLGKLMGSLRTTVGAIGEDLKSSSVQFRKDLAAVKSSVNRTKKEVEDVSGKVSACVSSVEEYSEEVKSLRAEMAVLRKQLAQGRPGQIATGTTAAVSAREVDILATNIAKISNRASQVETLQMGFDILKGRLERMEADYGSHLDTEAEEAEMYTDVLTAGGSKHLISTSEPCVLSSQPHRNVGPSGKKRRLTKTGAVEKRTQRRSSRRNNTKIG